MRGLQAAILGLRGVRAVYGCWWELVSDPDAGMASPSAVAMLKLGLSPLV